MANGEPISQQPAPANQPKPSLLRQILGSALTGLAAGLATERPEESFAAGMAAIEAARERERQRQIQQEELARQQQLVELRKREVETNISKTQAEIRQIDQQIALGNLNQIKIEQEIQSRTTREQIEIANATSQLISAVSRNGMSIVATLDKDPEKLDQFAKAMAAKGLDPVSDFIYINDFASGKVLVFERSSDVLKEDLEIDTPFGKFKAPKETPNNLVPALFTAFLSKRLEEDRLKLEERKANQDEFSRLSAFVNGLLKDNQSIRNTLARLISERNLTVDPKRVQQIDQEIAQLQEQLRENEEQLRAIRSAMARLTGVSGAQLPGPTVTSDDRVVSQAAEALKDLTPDKRDLALKQLIDQGVLTREQAEEVARRLEQGTRPSSGAPDAKELLKRGRETGGAFIP